MMLNEVVPRKLNVENEGTPKYTLIDEDGIYGNSTINAINIYKTYFNAGVDMTSNAIQNPDGTISYGKSDNTSDTFKALMKWYGLKGTDYLNKIVDRETLTGWDGYSKMEVQINNGVNITDTGLYEYYANVVKPFTEAMMFSAVSYITSSTDDWYARTGEGPTGTGNPHGSGMSYCYGCKQTVEQFNNTVANCQAPDTATIKGWENDGISGNEYRGNLSSSCQVGQGTRRWAGLIDTEINYSAVSPFNPKYWSGVDCSGFVQKTGEYATNWMSGINIPLIFKSGSWANSACMFFFDINDCKEQSDIGTPLAITDPASGFVYIFGHGDTQGTEHVEQKIHRGDLVEYQHHIAMVYCTPDDDPTGECAGLGSGEYKIIHAYGINYYNDPDIGRIFSRKVLITYQDIATPIGFGRIILWK